MRQAETLASPGLTGVDAEQPAAADPLSAAADRQVGIEADGDARQFGDQLVGDRCLRHAGQFKESIGLELSDEHDYDNFQDLVAGNITLGSTLEEMTPYADELRERVEQVRSVVEEHLQPSDDWRLELDELRQRGLQVDERDEDMYLRVLKQVRPARRTVLGAMDDHLILRPPVPESTRITEARRFNEATRTESELRGQVKAGEAEARRLEAELRRVGKPVGVKSATWILALLSVLGIVLPVVVMAF